MAICQKLLSQLTFDGTLAEHRYPKIGKAAEGGFGWLKKFQAEGALLILLTMRGGKELQEAVDFCAANGVSFWQVNDNCEQASWTDSRKVYAHHYVDDAAIGCPLVPDSDGIRGVVDWEIVGPLVMEKIISRKQAFSN